MEWVLQVVDEIDDAIGAARHRWLGFSAQINVLVVGIGALMVAVARTLTMRGTFAMLGTMRGALTMRGPFARTLLNAGRRKIL